MGEIRTKAIIENISVITECIENDLVQAGCPMEAIMQLAVATDEIISNVAFYAYEDGTGDVLVEWKVDLENSLIEIIFTDWGKPYNPLEKEDPDVTLPLELRQIGGLGVYIVKKTMDDVEYCYENGSNHLSLIKKW